LSSLNVGFVWGGNEGGRGRYTIATIATSCHAPDFTMVRPGFEGDGAHAAFLQHVVTACEEPVDGKVVSRELGAGEEYR